MEDAKIFDHHELRRAFRSASNALNELLAAAQPTGVTSLAAIRAIERLESTLEAHFRYEEAEAGFFAEVLSAAPERISDLDALRAEHPVLTAQLRRLVQAASLPDRSIADWRRLADGFARFASDLQRHEHAEDAVVADTLVADEGGSG